MLTPFKGRTKCQISAHHLHHSRAFLGHIASKAPNGIIPLVSGKEYRIFVRFGRRAKLCRNPTPVILAKEFFDDYD
jgi:hypothetical protein